MPPQERCFLTDQRCDRKMCIGGIDQITTATLKKRIVRQSEAKTDSTTSQAKKHEQSKTDLKSSQAIERFGKADANESATRSAKVSAKMSMKTLVNSSTDTGSSHSHSWTQTETPYNMLDVHMIAEIADRYDVSNTAAAAVASATIVTLAKAGLLVLKESQSKDLIIDRQKIWRARTTLRAANVEQFKGETVHALFFDGRKDKTLKVESGRAKVVSEEHISILREPGSLFVSHITTSDGKSRTITEGILERLADKNIDTTNIKAIGSDGENTNVGIRSGVIRQMETELGSKVQWLICLLHANELPLRNLARHLLGDTNDPNTFGGPTGRKLKTCEKMPIVTFERIEIGEELLDFDTSLLNTDNKYLIDICRLISTGKVTKHFENRPPGN